MTTAKRVLTILTFICVLFGNAGIQASAATDKTALSDLTYEYYMIQIAPEYTEPEEYPENTPNVLYASLGQMKNQGTQKFDGEITIPLPAEMENFALTTLGDYRQGESDQVQPILDYKIDEKNHTLTWKPNYAVESNGIYSYVIEFFYNPIKVGKDGAKSFTVVIEPQAAVKKMDILIESPAESADFKVEMDGSTATLSQYGTIANMYTYEDLKANDTKTFPISYVKADHKTTRERINNGEWNIPKDDMHGFSDSSAKAEESAAESNQTPLIGTVGAVIIGASILLAAILIVVGLMYKGKKQPKSVPQKTTASTAAKDEKKKLRTQLINGEIDQETYDREINKLL